MKLNTKKIRVEMRERRMNPSDLADAIKMRRQAVDYILKAKSTRLPTITKIAKVFGIDPKELLT